MVSYRHWSVLLWWDPNDVTHRRILPSYEAERWSVPASLCWWCCCCLADQLWVLIAYTRRRRTATHGSTTQLCGDNVASQLQLYTYDSIRVASWAWEIAKTEWQFMLFSTFCVWVLLTRAITFVIWIVILHFCVLFGCCLVFSARHKLEGTHRVQTYAIFLLTLTLTLTLTSDLSTQKNISLVR